MTRSNDIIVIGRGDLDTVNQGSNFNKKIVIAKKASNGETFEVIDLNNELDLLIKELVFKVKMYYNSNNEKVVVFNSDGGE